MQWNIQGKKADPCLSEVGWVWNGLPRDRRNFVGTMMEMFGALIGAVV